MEVNELSKRVLLLDLDSCTGCRACMVACSLAKEKVFGLNDARIWIPKMENICLSVPIICEQCDPAPCKTVCPTKAITRNAETCALVVDADKCIGCKECVWACPFGAISVKRGVAVKCDLCGGEPECAKVCIPGAVRYVELDRKAMEKRWKSLERRVKALLAILEVS